MNQFYNLISFIVEIVMVANFTIFFAKILTEELFIKFLSKNVRNVIIFCFVYKKMFMYIFINYLSALGISEDVLKMQDFGLASA